MPITNREDGSGSENDGEVILAPGHIIKLLETGNIEALQELAKQKYNFSIEDLANIAAYLKAQIYPPVITPLTKSNELLADYESRVQSLKAKELYTLFTLILPNLDAEATNYFLQSNFDDLVAISTFGGVTISELVNPAKIDQQSCDFLKQQVFTLFNQYNSLPDELKSDKTLAVINHLIDNFILPSEHLLNKSTAELGKELISWLKLMKKAPGEPLSRSGGTAAKIAAICLKLGEKADLDVTDGNKNNVLILLMQSKLPTDDVNKLTSLFVKYGASCHKTSDDKNSALKYAMVDLSFGKSVIEIMFRDGKIPIQYLRNMLQQAKSGGIFTPYILQIVDALARSKALANIEVQQLIAWVIGNSSAENSAHPSYGYRKHLHVLINYLLSDKHWNNFGLQFEQTCAWEQLSADECAEQISKLYSISAVLQAFANNQNLKDKLPNMLATLAMFIFSDKSKVKDSILPVQFLHFVAQNPQYVNNVAGSFVAGLFDSTVTARQYLLLSAATRDLHSSVFTTAANDLNYRFIQFVLEIFQQADKGANEFGHITPVISSGLRQVIIQLSTAKPDISQQFFGIEELIDAELANGMLEQAEQIYAVQKFMDTPVARKVTAPELNAVSVSLLHLALRLNAKFPRKTQEDTVKIETILNTQAMQLVEELPNANESKLAEVKSLLDFLHSKSNPKILDDAKEFFGFSTFESNLLSSINDAILAKHGKNQFMLNILGLATPSISKVMPSNSEDAMLVTKDLEVMLVIPPKSTFLGFGLFGQKAKQTWNDLVTATKESPVLANLLLNRQPETETTPRRSQSPLKS